MILYALVIFSMMGKPVYIMQNLDAETCLAAQAVVEEKVYASTRYYAECIIQDDILSL